MLKTIWCSCAIALLCVVNLFGAQHQLLKVVPTVDYRRYAGKWFEVARLPNRFEVKCLSNITAEYQPMPDGRIAVINRCLQAGNRVNIAEGVARRQAGQPPAVLEVRFAPAFLSFLSAVWGDYRIIELDDDYRYAVVGSNDRAYLWVLSRTPEMDAATYTAVVERAREQGFAVDAIIKTPQTGS